MIFERDGKTAMNRGIQTGCHALRLRRHAQGQHPGVTVDVALKTGDGEEEG